PPLRFRGAAPPGRMAGTAPAPARPRLAGSRSARRAHPRSARGGGGRGVGNGAAPLGAAARGDRPRRPGAPPRRPVDDPHALGRPPRPAHRRRADPASGARPGPGVAALAGPGGRLPLRARTGRRGVSAPEPTPTPALPLAGLALALLAPASGADGPEAEW